jgi:hypothetical protein
MLRMERGEPLKEAVQRSEILQIYVFIHTHFTWWNYVNLLVQMSFERLGNGSVVDDINYSPFSSAIEKERHVLCNLPIGS